jgi:hypothetical protein
MLEMIKVTYWRKTSRLSAASTVFHGGTSMLLVTMGIGDVLDAARRVALSTIRRGFFRAQAKFFMALTHLIVGASSVTSSASAMPSDREIGLTREPSRGSLLIDLFSIALVFRSQPREQLMIFPSDQQERASERAIS